MTGASPKYRRRPRKSRQGLVAVLVLVTLTAAALVAMASLQRVSQQSRQNARHAYRSQAVLMAEGAYSLAQIRLRRDGSYPGESWQISPDETALGEPATVVIQVTPGPEANLRNVAIEVELGTTVPYQTRETLKRTLNLAELEQDI